jgi:hypothetical protein
MSSCAPSRMLILMIGLRVVIEDSTLTYSTVHGDPPPISWLDARNSLLRWSNADGE